MYNNFSDFSIQRSLTQLIELNSNDISNPQREIEVYINLNYENDFEN